MVAIKYPRIFGPIRSANTLFSSSSNVGGILSAERESRGTSRKLFREREPRERRSLGFGKFHYGRLPRFTGRETGDARRSVSGFFSST